MFVGQYVRRPTHASGKFAYPNEAGNLEADEYRLFQDALMWSASSYTSLWSRDGTGHPVIDTIQVLLLSFEYLYASINIIFTIHEL